ncbi:MAG: hypothetical protein IJV69_03615 [Kiritimatiellae bacterium]|nr:hypothetical protein [Kiritimatiellia bacterium]
MSLGYLLASLPLLAPDRVPQITIEAFLSACESMLSSKDAAAVALLAYGADDVSVHPYVNQWRDLEAAIKGAIGQRRLAKRSGANGGFTAPETAACPVWLLRAVSTAFESASDPLAREEALMRIYWSAADELGGFDPVSKGQIFAYAVRLRLAMAKAARDAEVGAKRLEAALPAQTL